MTIDQIREWRKEGCEWQTPMLTMIDTLLAEVERLREAYNDVCTIERVDVLQGKLTIATEALEMIIYTSKMQSLGHEKYEVMAQHARTALERIEG